MGNKPRVPMPIEERAKQFMPFSALRGLPETLKEKEKIVVKKAELTEDAKEMLDQKLKDVEFGNVISVVYYCEDEYIKMTGIVSKIDSQEKYIQLVNTRIYFDNIYDIIFP